MKATTNGRYTRLARSARVGFSSLLFDHPNVVVVISFSSRREALSRARASTAPRGEGHAAATMPATRPSWVMTHAVVRSETRGHRVRSAFPPARSTHLRKRATPRILNAALTSD
jgi:hypothetical protein